MVGKRSLMAVAALMLAYGATPYIAIYRLMDAMRSGNASMLEATVDWDAVRAGLKQDIAAGIVGDLTGDAPPARTQLAFNTLGSANAATPVPPGGAALPPFGASFIGGIAGSMVDREVTPQHLAEMVRQLSPAELDSGPAIGPARLKHAFFDGPSSFELSVLCPGQDQADQPLRLRLAFRHGGWKVVRAWVPQDLIDLANSRT